jgi:iron complex outermembrane receptor protein
MCERLLFGRPRGKKTLIAASASVICLLATSEGYAQPSASAPASRPAPASQPRANCRAAIAGRAVDATTGEALRAVQIQLEKTGKTQPTVEARTDASGAFSLAGLCPGAYRLTARRADYEPQTRAVRALVAKAQTLALALEPRQLARLDDVVVEALAAVRDDTRSAITLEGDALARTRGRNLAESLEPIAGVTVLRSGNTSKPMIRGQFGRRVLMLFDRVRHEGQKWGLDYAPEIDPFAAGKLTVIKGAAGVRFGPDAVGGAILSDPLPLRLSPGYDGEVHLVGISNGRRGTLALRLDGAHPSIAGLAWRLEGNYSRGAALSTPDYPLDNTSIEEWNVGATIGYRRGAFEGKISYRRYNNQAGVFTGFHTSHTPDDFFASIERGRPREVEHFNSEYRIDRAYQQVSHDFLVARGAYRAKGVGRFEATYTFQLDLREEFEIVRQSITGPQYDFTLHTHTLDLVFEHDPISLGKSWRLEGRAGMSGMFQRNLYVGLPLIPNYRSFAGGVYAIERLLGRSIEIEGGLRYDHISRQALIDKVTFDKAAQRGRLSSADCKQKSAKVYRCPHSFNAVTFSAGALWRFAKGFNAKINLASATRAPNIDEQYLEGASPSFPVFGIGAPQLGLETTWSASATVSGATSWLAFELSGYINLINNYIYFSPAINPDGTPMIDVLVRGSFPRFVYSDVDALFYGADGSVVFKAPKPLSLELDLRFTMVRAQDADDGSYLVFIPPDRARATLTYKFPKLGMFDKTFASLTATLVSRQNRFDINADFAPPPDGYWLLGAAIGTELSVNGQRVRITAEGRNLLDARYRDYISLVRYFADEPGLEVLVRVSGFVNL